MSTSRLEKFIYAICSMEVSDLPAPLSRIEKLWNCLITGETPDFEPQSRNEKYLMAMIGSYDISNLPAPLSRGEKLLYKIAVGETDLSDVPGYLSRYEELLKYLIENGGISGGDFEYVLYTLNQSLSTLYSTVEKPVKSAILKGNTKLFDSVNNEVNEPNCPNTIQGYYLNTSTGELVSASTSCVTEHFIECPNMPFKIRGNNKYKRVVFCDENKSFISGKEWRASGNNDEVISNIPENAKYIKISFSISVDDTTTYTPSSKIELLDDNENNLYLTHIESVKMPVLTTIGKNLFNSSTTTDGYEFNNDTLVQNSSWFVSDFIKTKPNSTYAISGKTSGNRVVFYDINKNKIGNKSMSGNKITTIDNCYYIRINGLITEKNTWQVEEGAQATPYEPYKSNILTVNEDVELRGIGEVKDELNLTTGEVTNRIGEVTLDGSNDEAWRDCNPTNNSFLSFLLALDGKQNSANFTNDKMINKPTWDANVEGIWADCNIIITFKRSTLATNDLTGARQWLSQNPITVQYELSTPIVKTVDLTILDQDGQPTKLKTFNDITHVEIKANNLIPTVDLEVATKISETLSTLGLDHHDISETQNKLGQTIDEQSENTDATMMATTEIYEQTL